MSDTILARIGRVTAVALPQGFTVEAAPSGYGAQLRLRKGAHSGTVNVDANGELVAWRTGRREPLEQLKAALA
jgi:hypothetical protein